MKSYRLCSATASLAVIAILFSGCSHVGKKSPPDVVRAFFAAANSGKYAEAEGYLTSSMKPIIGLAGGIKKVVDDDTRNGTLTSVEILKVDTRGEGAKVD